MAFRTTLSAFAAGIPACASVGGKSAPVSKICATRLFSSTALRSQPGGKHQPLIGRYDDTFPDDLFRINASPKVILRNFEAQKKLGRSSYDLHVHEDGKVHPRPGPNFEGPNGASMRPNGPMMQEIVRNFRGKNTTIYLVPKGTAIPPELVLLHEHSDHFSLQCTKPMSLAELNRRLTAFMQEHAESMTKEEFVERFPFMP